MKNNVTIIFLALLYFCEGSAIGLLWWRVPERLHVLGVPQELIAILVSLVPLPWLLKFLWAPGIDYLRLKGFQIRTLIVMSLAVMAMTLMPLLWIDWELQFFTLLVLLILHSLFAATLDTAVDALCIYCLPTEERAKGIVSMQVGMLLGRGVLSFMGGFLILNFNDHPAIIYTIALLITVGLMLCATKALYVSSSESSSNVFVHILDKISFAFKSQKSGQAILIAVCGGFIFSALDSYKFATSAEINTTLTTYLSFWTTPLLILGATSCCLFNRWWSLESQIKIALGIGMVSVAFLGLQNLTSHSLTASWITSLTLFLFFVSFGQFVVASYSYYAIVSDPIIGASQFALFMAGTNLGESIASYAATVFVPLCGLEISLCLLSIPTLVTFFLVNARLQPR